MSTRSPLRIAAAVSVLLAFFWVGRVSTAPSVLLVVYFAGIFVEAYFHSQVAEGSRKPKRTSKVRSSPYTWQAEGRVEHEGTSKSGLRDLISTLVTILALAIMGDAFFFTNWIMLPESSANGGEPAWIIAIKIVASLLALAVTLIGPIVAGLFVWFAVVQVWEDRRDTSVTGLVSGTVALVPGIAVSLLYYSHFLMGHAIYQILGATSS